MLVNYFTSAVRFFWRGGLFSIINTCGLVAGITASTFLFLYVWDELRYDSFHSNADRIFRVTTQQPDGAMSVVTPGPLGPKLAEQHSSIENIARVGKWSGSLRYKQIVFEESEIYFADNSFLKIFDFPLSTGDINHALLSPKDIVLTETSAVKYFGNNWKNNGSLLGSVLTLNGTDDFVVAGVISDPPNFSSIQFDLLISFEYIRNDKWSYQWGSSNFNTYVLLQSEADGALVSEAIKGDLAIHAPGFTLALQPLASIYLERIEGYDWGRHGQKQYVIIFSVVAAIILTIACFNYVNLSTARARKRSREVGIRKVIGANRNQLIAQFMGESFLIVLMSALASRGLIDMLMPLFNSLTGKELESSEFQQQLIFMMGSIVVVTCLLSGIYPAMLLSSFKPLNVVNGTGNVMSGQRFRNILVTAQFMVSMILVSGTIVVFKQLSFIQSKDIGFDRGELAYIRLSGGLAQKSAAFKQELLGKSFVKSATRTTSPLVNLENGSYIDWPGKIKGEEITISQINVDEDFLPLLNATLITGRNFNANDSTAYILNEIAIKAMGLNIDKALGTQIDFWGTKGTIVGITMNFNFQPLRHAIAPLIIRHAPLENFYYLVFRIDKGSMQRFAEEAEAVYKKYEHEHPFQYAFVDEMIDAEYHKDVTAGKIILTFSVLSVIIATMGLFGLVAYVVEVRAKELSIRKILGSSQVQTFVLLSKQFMVILICAFIVSIPLSIWTCSVWLSNFAYQTPLVASIYLNTALFVSAGSILVILVQSIVASLRNPVTVLKASD